MKEATEFLKNLKAAQWHNLNDIPTELKDSVWSIIDGNSLDGYRFYIHEEYDYLYMKLKDAAKEQLKMDINQVVRDWENIDWVWCKCNGEGYILELTKTNEISKATGGCVKATSHEIFTVLFGKHVTDSDVTKFLFNKFTNIKPVYYREEIE